MADMTRAPMTRARHPERDMHLPDGKTCADCWHFARCSAIYGHIAADEVCDWAPSSFQDAARPSVRIETEDDGHAD